MQAKKSELTPVRVKDIILHEDHPEYKKFGKVESIGVIKYAPINVNVDTSDTKALPAAFPLDHSNKTCPLINEIVFLTTAYKDVEKDSTVTYYLSPISLFNEINYNPSNDGLDKSNRGPGYEFPVKTKKRPLHPFHGDVILQGRHGQGLRFTGAKSFLNPFTNDSNNGLPLTIITNGHRDETAKKLYIEDINKDLSSVYLTSDHIIPLEQSRDKYAGAKKRPVLAKNYKGPQVLINSGRLYFNASEDDILLSSTNYFSVSAKNVSLDGVEAIGFDAKRIYLGEKAVRFELQPVLLGNQTELFLFQLLTALGRLSTALINARTANQIPIPALNLNGFTLQTTVNSLLNQINPNGDSQLKSKKVYTE